MKSRKVPLPAEMVELVAQRFRLLGEPVRLRLLQALEGGERTVNELAETLEGTQPNISRHLNALFDGGLVGRRREGSNIYYFISDPVVLELCELVCASTLEYMRVRLSALEAPSRSR